MVNGAAGEFHDPEEVSEEAVAEEAAIGRIRWGRMSPLPHEEEDRRGTQPSTITPSLSTNLQR